MDADKITRLVKSLNQKEKLLKEKEIELADQQEEFQSQKEELTAAVEELVEKNSYLIKTLDQLKQRNSELDNILYRASHDLKTPVSSIYGLIDILKSGILNDDQQLAMSHLFQQTQQMEMRLTSLTNLSIAFFTEPVWKSCSVRELCCEIWDSIGTQTNINLQFVTEDAVINTDSKMLSIALKCLFQNAITYRDSSVAGYVKVSVVKNLNSIQIDVVDNGEGVEQIIENRIFDMFYRGSERSKGFGNGLYIAKTIALKLNGNIRFIPRQSETTFRLILQV